MKKIIIKKLLILFGTLTLSFGLLSCEKEASVGDDLIGTWYMPQTLNRHTAGKSANDVAAHSLNAWNWSMVITTNSNQALIDRMADSEGAISISGIVDDEIKFMNGWLDKESGDVSVSLSNYNWNTFGNHNMDKPMIGAYMDNFSHQYQDSVDIFWNDSTGTYDTFKGWWYSDYIGIYYQNDSYIEIQDEFDFTFDGKNLQIPYQTFSVDDSTSLTMGGTLSHATIDIPANTPTEIFTYKGDTSFDYGTWAINIKEDGRWVEIYTWEDPYDSSGWSHTYTDSTIAEWELEGDTLFVTYHYEDIWVDAGDPGIGQGTWIYQVAYSYKIEGSDLSLTNEFDMCQGGLYCIEWFEWEYGLESGSLDEFKMVWGLEFTKLPAQRSRELRGPFRNVIGRFPPYSLMK